MDNNNLSMMEKLKDVLTRNYSTLQIEIIELPFKYDLLTFKMHSGFSSNDLNGIFSYWGVDWRFYIKEWSVDCNNNITVEVRLFIFKEVICENNDHNFIKNRGWGKTIFICNKCGLFERRINNG